MNTRTTRIKAMPTSRRPHHLGHDWVSLTKAATTGNTEEIKNTAAVASARERCIVSRMIRSPNEEQIPEMMAYYRSHPKRSKSRGIYLIEAFWRDDGRCLRLVER